MAVVPHIVVNAELRAARSSFGRTLRLISAMGLLWMFALALLAFWVSAQLTSSDVWQAVVGSTVLLLMSVPTTALAATFVAKLVGDANDLVDQSQHRMELDRRQRDLEAQIADALEMADHEPEALRMIERTLETIAPEAMSELLLADNSQAHLSRRAVAGAEMATGCGVDSPHQCPAARRARMHRFPDSDDINACPKLANRASGRCSAVCIPVSVTGRTVGVIHTVTDVTAPLPDATIQSLLALANHSGSRLGMLRVMKESQLQAATDSLTGLANRRAFENRFLQLRDRMPHAKCVIVMADLDHFKAVNDTYGHETGDRSLRVFADTLRKTLGVNDLVARRGGEEFAIALPDCDTTTAHEVLERVRTELQNATRSAGLPSFSASFGVTPGFLAEDLDLLLARADAGLFEAKRNGRDQIVTFSAADLDDATERADLLSLAKATWSASTLDGSRERPTPSTGCQGHGCDQQGPTVELGANDGYGQLSS